jgi:hypothetical protein
MAHRALARALQLVLSHLGRVTLANLCAFAALLPALLVWMALMGSHPVVSAFWLKALMAAALAAWAWACFSWLASWTVDLARGSRHASLAGFTGAWVRQSLAPRSLAFAALALFFTANGLALLFYGWIMPLPPALRLILLCLTASLGLWGAMAAQMALGFGAEQGLGAWEQLKLASFAPVAYLPSSFFALVLGAWCSGALALAALRFWPAVARWLFPLFMPLAFLPVVTLALMAAFLAFLAEEMQMASMGFPPPQARLPGLREVLRPWE